MTDDELADELRRLVRVARPVSTFKFPEVDFTHFNAYHDKLAQILDPTGEHRRAAPPQRHSRRLSYVALITAGGFMIEDLKLTMNEQYEENSSFFEDAGQL